MQTLDFEILSLSSKLQNLHFYLKFKMNITTIIFSLWTGSGIIVSYLYENHYRKAVLILWTIITLLTITDFSFLIMKLYSGRNINLEKRQGGKSLKAIHDKELTSNLSKLLSAPSVRIARSQRNVLHAPCVVSAARGYNYVTYRCATFRTDLPSPQVLGIAWPQFIFWLLTPDFWLLFP